MKLNAGSTFQQPPVGTHIATLIKIVDIGTQTSDYKGVENKRRQGIFTWELPFETMDDGQPFIISKFYTLSLGEKATLTKDLISWLGKAPDPETFDPQTLLGKSCQVIVVEREGSDKKVVSGLAPISKGTSVPDKPHNPIVFFDLDNFDADIFENLSDGIKGMIVKSPEYLETLNGDDSAQEEAVDDDKIPF